MAQLGYRKRFPAKKKLKKSLGAVAAPETPETPEAVRGCHIDFLDPGVLDHSSQRRCRFQGDVCALLRLKRRKSKDILSELSPWSNITNSSRRLSELTMPHSDHDGRLVKRQKLGSVANTKTDPAKTSRIFTPYRVGRSPVTAAENMR